MARSGSRASLSGGRFALAGLAMAGPVAAMLVGGCSSSGQGTGGVVTAVETEYQIVLSRTSFTPGTYTFDVINHGQVAHSLEIVGPGIKGQKLPHVLASGQSASMTVTLRTGTYDVFCQVDHHRARGMNVVISVSG